MRVFVSPGLIEPVEGDERQPIAHLCPPGDPFRGICGAPTAGVVALGDTECCVVCLDLADGLDVFNPQAQASP